MSGRRRSRKKGLTTGDKLFKWNKYYASQNFGIAVECTSCKKWRRVQEYAESHEVPVHWVCSMSIIDGKPGHCDIPTKYTSDSFVDEDYVPGSIVWAKLPRFPWWPAMVEDDPDCEEYHVVGEEEGDEEYHVVFFYDTPSRKWVNTKNLTTFVKPPTIGKVKPCWKKKLENAERKAKLAVPMTIKERLKHFSFANTSKAKFPRSRTNTKIPKIPKVQPSTNNVTDEEMPNVPVQPKSMQPKSKRKNVPKVTGPAKRKRETKATANQDLPIKKRKTFEASVPQTSQTPDTDAQNTVASDSTVTSQALVPVNPFQPETPQSPATAENSQCDVPIQAANFDPCSASEQTTPDNVEFGNNEEQNESECHLTSFNSQPIQAANFDPRSVSDPEQITLNNVEVGNSSTNITECKCYLTSFDSQPPSPYPVPDCIKRKPIDKLFSDIDSDDLNDTEVISVNSDTTVVDDVNIETAVVESYIETPVPEEIEEKYIITENGEVEKFIDDTPDEVDWNLTFEIL